MTPEQIAIFQEKGILFLGQALSREQVDPLKEYILSELKRLKIWSSGKILSASIKSMPAFQQITKLSSLIKRDNLHSEIINEKTLSAISSLAGTSLLPAQSQYLLSLPDQGDWSLKDLKWHTDISTSNLHCLSGIQVFILIDEVKPRGGATLAIAGSHQLAGQGEVSRRFRESLRREDFESELSRRNFSLVEMSGRAGDIYLMDMRLLHTPSTNSTNKIRMMATIRYLPLMHGQT